MKLGQVIELHKELYDGSMDTFRDAFIAWGIDPNRSQAYHRLGFKHGVRNEPFRQPKKAESRGDYLKGFNDGEQAILDYGFRYVPFLQR